MKHKKILIIRFSSMGDVVMVSPVVRLLHNQLNAKVDILTKEDYFVLYQFNPYIHKIQILEQNSAKSLMSEEYTYIIDLQKSLRSLLLSWKIGKTRFTYKKEYFKTFLRLNFRKKFAPLKHVTTRYIDAVTPLGIIDDGLGLDLFLNGHSSNIKFENENYIVIVIGGTYETKRIPLQLAKAIAQDRCRKYVLLGGKDVDMGDYKPDENVVNLVGTTDILTSASIIRHSSLVITGDTGMMHIAAAFQISTIVIWGSTDTFFGFYPYYGKMSPQNYHSIKVPGLSCRPCSKYGRKRCPKGHMKCLRSIVLQEVLTVVDQCMKHTSPK